MKNRLLKTLKADIEAVIKKYPELEPILYKGIPVGVEGIIDIHDLDGKKRGTFQIQVDVPADYPHAFPSLRELSKLIPRIIDRHIYENGNCCVSVLQNQLIEAKKGIYIDRYFTDYVVPYLANQIHYDEYGVWTNEEYKHGYSGQIQYYKETIDTEDLSVLLRAIEIAANRINVPRNQLCFCSSNIKYKKCHISCIEELQIIGREQLLNDWNKIRAIAKKDKL